MSARAAAAAPAREPSAPRAASAALRDAAPATVAPTRIGVASKTLPRDARRRDSLLRWLVVPAALAAAYVVGFLTSQMLETLRPSVAPAGVAVGAPEVAPPSVSAPPPHQAESAAAPPPVAEIQTPDASTALLPPVAVPTAPAMAAPAADSAEAAAPSAPEAAATEPVAKGAAVTEPAVAPPAVSAAPPPAPARVRRPPPPPRNVEVNIEAEPGASILVNGQPVGSGTAKGLELAPGPHMVEVRLPDGRTVERVIDVKGTRYDIKVR
jgi:hypothetical protein